MSDRIAIFDGGRIEQLGTGEDLYERPMLALRRQLRRRVEHAPRTVQRDGEGGWLQRGGSRWRIDPSARRRRDLGDGDPAALVVRPEHLRVVALDAARDGANALDAAVTEVLYLGPTRKIELALADGLAAVAREPAGRSATGGRATGSGSSGPRTRAVVVPDQRRTGGPAAPMPRAAYVPEDSLHSPRFTGPSTFARLPLRADAGGCRCGDRRRPVRHRRHLPGRRSVRAQRGPRRVGDAPPVQQRTSTSAPSRCSPASTTAMSRSCPASPSGATSGSRAR